VSGVVCWCDAVVCVPLSGLRACVVWCVLCCVLCAVLFPPQRTEGMHACRPGALALSAA
jgi:hypothetical protein